MSRPRVPPRTGWRLPLLASGGLALVGGLYAALLLLGTPVPDTTAGLGAVHGPVMVFGFVGTLIALERAVALRAGWAMVAPACSGLGALLLLAGAPTIVGQLLLAAAGVGLLGIYAALWRRQATVAILAQAAGALCWYAAVLLWLGRFPIDQVIPWLSGFVVLTIAGERLELSPLGLTGARSGKAIEAWFLAAVAAVLSGAVAGVLWPRAGTRLWGLALLGVVGWLAAFDVARHTIRGRGLPRFVAVGLLTGYGWLALAGLLWAGGLGSGGPGYDATTHAVFLGFTMSMIFAHAPVILPAVLRRPLPYRPVLYAPLVLLHLSLLARVAVGDGAGVVAVWRWAGVVNEVAVVGFVICAAVLTLSARRIGSLPRRSVPDRVPAKVTA